MGLPVLIMGRSGTGKSASLRDAKNILLVNVNKKPLPFSQTDNIVCYNCDDIIKIRAALQSACEQKKFKSFFIDDFGYILVKKFMAGHRGAKGNNQFELYNDLADNVYNFIQFVINDLPDDTIVYIVMHEDKNDFGETKPKTIGKLLDDKVCIEGLFTIVLRALKQDGRYVFATATDGLDVAKTPIGMFKDQYIENSIAIVEKSIRDYYKIDINNKENK